MNIINIEKFMRSTMRQQKITKLINLNSSKLFQKAFYQFRNNIAQN